MRDGDITAHLNIKPLYDLIRPSRVKTEMKFDLVIDKLSHPICVPESDVTLYSLLHRCSMPD